MLLTDQFVEYSDNIVPIVIVAIELDKKILYDKKVKNITCIRLLIRCYFIFAVQIANVIKKICHPPKKIGLETITMAK